MGADEGVDVEASCGSSGGGADAEGDANAAAGAPSVGVAEAATGPKLCCEAYPADV